MDSEEQIVADAATAMSNDELAAAIATLQAHERELLLAGDIDRARRAAMDKAVFLSVQVSRHT
ncbi:MAG: hypothetical protein WAW17_19675 [Rhodococcus sp. (in: high G+C Gram-positive bacteria)]|uniref:hypothetical protein n=1 Tax=Rhodococcus sp. TaxID=1831 RepID=UPI003BAF504B